MAGITVSILYSKDDGRVLYLEAGKEFVDLLLWLLELPTGAVIKLIADSEGASTPFAGVANIYNSVDKLNSSALDVDKEKLTNPSARIAAPKLLEGVTLTWGPTPTLTPRCRFCKHTHPPGRCPTCSQICGRRCTECGHDHAWNAHCASCEELCDSCIFCPHYHYTSENCSVAGCPCYPTCVGRKAAAVPSSRTPSYVKENVTFMVTNSLEFYPTSTIKSINLLNQLGVASMGNLASQEVVVDETLGLKLVKAAMSSKTVLQDVFSPLLKKGRVIIAS